MEAKFYQFAKKHNSTKQPTGLTSAHKDVTLNDGLTSILSPSIRIMLLNDVDATFVLRTNYVWLSDFNRYYYILDWTYNGDGTWTASCKVDVFASWKADILLSGGYMARDSYERTADQIDTLYPASTSFLTRTDGVSTGLTVNPGSGTYVIGVLSSQAPNVGAVSYYKVNHTQLSNMMSKMMTTIDTVNWTDVDSITGDALKSLVNPIQYIVSCKWFPFSTTLTNNDSIYLWGWNTTATGDKIVMSDQPIRTFNYRIDLGDIQDTAVHEYPKLPPFAKYCLVTAWGSFDLDPVLFVNDQNRHINISMSVNLITGICLMRVYIGDVNGHTGTNMLLFQREIPMAFDIPLAQYVTDYVSIADSAVGMLADVVGAAVGFGPVTNRGIIGNLGDAVQSAISPSVQTTTGTGGSFMPEIQTMFVLQTRYAPVNRDKNTFGFINYRHVDSLTAYVAQTNISGYVLMAHSDFEKDTCTYEEQQEITDTLEGAGVYLE